MEQETKLKESEKVLANKVKIWATIPQYLQDDIKNYSALTGYNKSETLTKALTEFFNNKILENDNLLIGNSLYFQLPLNKTFKDNAIANKTKLNIDLETKGDTVPVNIIRIKNNLDIFNGSSYTAGEEYITENIKHRGIDFIIIPEAVTFGNTIYSNRLDINITDSLYVFYYVYQSDRLINVYLIKPIEAINNLAGANENKTSKKLIQCLNDLETLETEINKKYSEEVKQLEKNNKYVSNKKKEVIINSYNQLLHEVLKELAIKYNNPYIKIGSTATKTQIIQETSILESYNKSLETLKELIKNNYDDD